jgi:hypothetical protein
MEYGKIISQAFRITWQKKLLWIFAFLTVLPTILFGIFSPIQYDFQQFYGATSIDPEQMAQFLPWLFFIVCFSAGSAFLLTPLSIAGVVKGVYIAKSNRRTTARDLFKESLKYYWRLLVIPIILGVAAVVIAFLFGIVFIAIRQSDLSILYICMLPLICILFFAILLLSVEVLFTYIAVVIEDWGVGEAMSRAWDILRNNFWPIFGALIIFGIIGLVFSLAFNWIFSSILYAIAGINPDGTLNAPLSNDPIKGFILYGFSLLNYLATAILTVFTYAVWTLAYLDLSEREEATKKVDAYLKGT